eukprot:3507795-Pleurochrysis_carterae.AAC.2
MEKLDLSRGKCGEKQADLAMHPSPPLPGCARACAAMRVWVPKANLTEIRCGAKPERMCSGLGAPLRCGEDSTTTRTQRAGEGEKLLAAAVANDVSKQVQLIVHEGPRRQMAKTGFRARYSSMHRMFD